MRIEQDFGDRFEKELKLGYG